MCFHLCRFLCTYLLMRRISRCIVAPLLNICSLRTYLTPLLHPQFAEIVASSLFKDFYTSMEVARLP